MIKVDARGEQCPIPVVKTKEAIKQLGGSGKVEVLVDNEIAVQNLTKMAQQKGYSIVSEKLSDTHFKAVFTILNGETTSLKKEAEVCYPDSVQGNMIAVIAADTMGTGDESLGKALLKGFIYALAKGDVLPKTILLYNRGAFMSIEGSDSLEDLKSMEAQGVEILTCGTCLNHYGLTEKLAVGGVTNMYTIVEKMTEAAKIIKP